VVILDEIEHLRMPLDRLGELIKVGRGVRCSCILSLQSVAQLRNAFRKERASALLSGMTTSIILQSADAESVEFARATIGTHFEEYTAHESRESIPGGGSIITEKETRLHEEHGFVAGDFYRADFRLVVVAQRSG
jgi:type IV secretory pathway TraG/TraD family ATPase VirD4